MSIVEGLPIDADGWYRAIHQGSRIRISPWTIYEVIYPDMTELPFDGLNYSGTLKRLPSDEGIIIENITIQVPGGSNANGNTRNVFSFVQNGETINLYFLGKAGNQMNNWYAYQRHRLHELDILIDPGTEYYYGYYMASSNSSCDIALTYRVYDKI